MTGEVITCGVADLGVRIMAPRPVPGRVVGHLQHGPVDPRVLQGHEGAVVSLCIAAHTGAPVATT